MQSDFDLLASLINIDYTGKQKNEAKNICLRKGYALDSPDYQTCFKKQKQKLKTEYNNPDYQKGKSRKPKKTFDERIERQEMKVESMKSKIGKTSDALRRTTGFPLKKLIAIAIVFGLGLAIFLRPEMQWLRDFISNNDISLYVMIGVGILALYIIFK
tara:strand:- start:4980 stop:5453 length:474 start_codon:yes stop_codon:yes gene_type:complete